jgi:hypothetical protein
MRESFLPRPALTVPLSSVIGAMPIVAGWRMPLNSLAPPPINRSADGRPSICGSSRSRLSMIYRRGDRKQQPTAAMPARSPAMNPDQKRHLRGDLDGRVCAERPPTFLSPLLISTPVRAGCSYCDGHSRRKLLQTLAVAVLIFG